MSISFLKIPGYAQSPAEYLLDGNEEANHGENVQAIIDYSKAIEADPDFAKAYNNRGVAYAKEGSFERAINDFTMAIAVNPNDAEAFNNRGRAYSRLGNIAQALSDYTSAIRRDPFYVKAYNNRELILYQLKEYDKAWSDVDTVKIIGGVTDPDFIAALKMVSGRDE